MGFDSTKLTFISGRNRRWMRAGGVEIAAEAGLRELRHLGRDLVRDHRDDAAAAERHQRDGDGVVAREHSELRRDLVDHVRHLPDVARRFLHADDVLDLRQPRQRGGLDVHAGAPLHAVDDDRQPDGRGDRPVVLVEAFLGGLVVVRRHREDAVGAHALELAAPAR